MKTEILPNGNLRILADAADREALAEIYADSEKGYLDAEQLAREALRELGFEFVLPEWIGALTSAPIFADCVEFVEFPDSGEFYVPEDARVWWFPAYEITDPWETLRDTGEVIFTASE